MTEDEAKTKECRVSNSATVGTCSASACMHWRWSEARRTIAFLEAVQADMKKTAKPNFNASVRAVYADRGGQFARTEGYCGLAGTDNS